MRAKQPNENLQNAASTIGKKVRDIGTPEARQVAADLEARHATYTDRWKREQEALARAGGNRGRRFNQTQVLHLIRGAVLSVEIHCPAVAATIPLPTTFGKPPNPERYGEAVAQVLARGDSFCQGQAGVIREAIRRLTSGADSADHARRQAKAATQERIASGEELRGAITQARAFVRRHAPEALRASPPRPVPTPVPAVAPVPEEAPRPGEKDPRAA